MDLSSPVSVLSPKSRSSISALNSIEIRTVRDLLFHFPFRYEDFSRCVKLADARAGEQVTVIAEVEKVRSRRA